MFRQKFFHDQALRFRPQDTAGAGTLSDKTKQSLTSALSVLGVSHDDVMLHGNQHHIFVLGLDAEDLREVVRINSTLCKVSCVEQLESQVWGYCVCAWSQEGVGSLTGD